MSLMISFQGLLSKNTSLYSLINSKFLMNTIFHQQTGWWINLSRRTRKKIILERSAFKPIKVMSCVPLKTYDSIVH